MEVICLGEESFDRLLAKVIAYVDAKLKYEEKWLSTEQAMHKLRIKSKSTLQKLRDEGKIRFSQPQKKLIVYDAESINEYLEKHAKRGFKVER